MKTIPPVCPEPESGVKYWRSLDQLAETPEFRQWVDREFPAGASEFTDPTSRRYFVKIMSASFLLAGLGGAGCRRPEHGLVPFSKMPDNYVHGVSQFYATAMPTRAGAVPLVVKSHEGRPVKLEGNPQHPDSNGGTDLHTQAAILGLYDPDRATRFTKDGNSIAGAAVVDYLADVSRQFTSSKGAGLRILAGRSTSPTRQRLQARIEEAMPEARWHTYEAVPVTIHQEAATAAFGQPVVPYYQLDKATIIVSLDYDFVNGEDDSHRLQRGFAKGRKITNPGDAMNRLYVIEGLMSLTGSNADHRLRRSPTGIIQAARDLAAAIVDKGSVQDKWIAECANDLIKHQGKAVVVAGHRQPLEVHLLAHAINAALGAVGPIVTLNPAPKARELGIAELAKDLSAGQVDTLVILGGNPAYTAPADLNWVDAQRKAKQVIRLGYYEDETFAGCTWHIPAAHFLESWGDARTSDGTVVAIQPMIEPLFGGLTEIEVLARLTGSAQVTPLDIVRETTKLDENGWRKFLHDGFLTGPAAASLALQAVPITATKDAAAAARAGAAKFAAPGKDNLEVIFHKDYSLDDGQWNNNGWLQELPDPMTKIVWDNAVLMSPKTAREFGLERNANPKAGKFFQDLVQIELAGRRVTGPVWIQPGMADYTIGLALGYGRTKTGRVGRNTGFNAYTLRTSTALNYGVGAKMSVVPGTYMLATTQEHGALEGRPIIREGNLEQFKAKPDFAKNMDLEAHAPNAGPIYQHPYNSHPEMKSKIHQWGMAIDLNSCTGCNACVLACQSENNIPIVGKEQVSKGREMHWMRIDRYFSSSFSNQANATDDPQVTNQPMLCQHCESAPCESVCPVNATVHDEEGLNLMAYNRCVGTRYCSNNCPYKVRRFNFFDYNRRSITNLYASPLDPRNRTDGEWEMKRWFKKPEEGNRPHDEWDMLKLISNPDVSVRMRGVMEKCTFCLQRIEGAKIAQKIKAGASGDVEVRDGTFTTACAQSCPTEAIAFGNILDPKSKVSQLKETVRNYAVLGFLDTKPRLTYLARIRNPNPAMPDYHKMPLSLEEYSRKHGNPTEAHGASHAPGDHKPGNSNAAHDKKGAH